MLFEFQGRRSHSEGSTWKNVLSKLKMMLPYIWPKGDCWLQFVVIFCLLLLATGRVVNVFVPIYYKYIGMSHVQLNTSVQAKWYNVSSYMYFA